MLGKLTFFAKSGRLHESLVRSVRDRIINNFRVTCTPNCADVLFWPSSEPVPGCLWLPPLIACNCTNVDHLAGLDRKIIYLDNSDRLGEVWATAELTLLLILKALRASTPGKEIHGRRFHVDGDGRLAMQLIRLIGNLGGRFSPLGEASVVILARRLVPATDGYVNAEWLARLSPGTILINPARGGLIIERDVSRALIEGGLGFYASDFRPQYTCPGILHAMTNTYFTNHIGGKTEESTEKTQHIVLDMLEEWVEDNDKAEVKSEA